jgi:hypothetical protein
VYLRAEKYARLGVRAINLLARDRVPSPELYREL